MISKPPTDRRRAGRIFRTIVHELRRLWPVVLILAASVAIFHGPTLLSVFWRLSIAALAFLAAQLMWKATFGHLDFERHMAAFWDLISKAQRGESDMEAAIAHSIIVLGVLFFRAALYVAIIHGVLSNIGGA